MLKLNSSNPSVSKSFGSRLTYENNKTGFKREIDSKKDFYDKEILSDLNAYLKENSSNLIVTANNKIALNVINREPLSVPCYLTSFDNGIEIMQPCFEGERMSLTYTKSNINGELVPVLNEILNKTDTALNKEKTAPKQSESIQDKMYAFAKVLRDLFPILHSKL